MTRVRQLFVVPLVGFITATAGVSVHAQPELPPRPKEMKVVELVRAIQDRIVRVDVAGMLANSTRARNSRMVVEGLSSFTTGCLRQVAVVARFPFGMRAVQSANHDMPHGD